MINSKMCGVHQIKMQQHKKKLNNVCVFKKKEFEKKKFHEQLLITSIF